MLKITELRKAMEAAEAVADQAECYGDAERAYLKARTACYAEIDAAKALRAQYEAMGDENAIGETNAGDTFDRATYGDDRHRSTEYWNCAIDSFQMFANA